MNDMRLRLKAPTGKNLSYEQHDSSLSYWRGQKLIMALYTSLVIYNTYNNFQRKDTLSIRRLFASVVVPNGARFKVSKAQKVQIK
jgi:hypothetical protein